MQRQPIVAQSVKSAGYEPRSRTLEVEFQNGRVFCYADVPEPVYAGLLRASAPDAYFCERIKSEYTYWQPRELALAAPER